MRLYHRAQPMQTNAITRQDARGVSALSALVVAAMTRGVSRGLAGRADPPRHMPISRITQWATTVSEAECEPTGAPGQVSPGRWAPVGRSRH